MRSKPRISVILPQNEPFSWDSGAFANTALELFGRLTDAFDVTVYSIGVPPSRRIAHPGLKVRYLWSGSADYTQPLYGILKVFYFLELFLKVDRTSDYTFVMNRPGYVRYLAPFLKKTRLILFMGNKHLVTGDPQTSRRALESAHQVICVSDYIRQDVLRKFPEFEDKLVRLYNGVDIDRFYPDAARTREKKDGLTILFVGRLCHDKGVHILIEAMKRVIREFPDVCLKIVGSSWFGTDEKNDYIRDLEEASREIKDHIVFTGFIPNKDIHAVYREADIFVSPSIIEEAFGIMNVEAMASGLAVISSNRGGIPEVIGDAGILVDPEDPEELAEKILMLCRDENGRHTFGQEARRRVMNCFGWDMIARELRGRLGKTVNG